MRPFAIATLILLLTPGLVAVAAGSGSGVAFAGASQKAFIDEPFVLTGHVEGFGAGATVSWSAPAGCTLEAPSALVTAATCDAAGVHAFTLSATDGAAVASDVTTVAVRKVAVDVLVDATGHTDVGLPDDDSTITGLVDGATVRNPFEVREDYTLLTATLSWTPDAPHPDAPGQARNDFDMRLKKGATEWDATSTSNPEVIRVAAPGQGFWNAHVKPYLVVDADWHLVVEAERLAGDADIPRAHVMDAVIDAGEAATLAVGIAGGAAPYTVRWETDATSRAFDDGTGAEFTLAPTESTLVRALIEDAAGMRAVARGHVYVGDDGPAQGPPLTVVAVIDGSFSPYHGDFLASHHPWNLDADAENDFGFHLDPALYIDGHPGGVRVDLTLPTDDTQSIAALHTADAVAWAGFPSSSLASGVNLAWFPGTKIVGAATFGGTGFYGTPSSHGSASASVAAGNLHGTCPECVFVLLNGNAHEALAWAAAQPWIDVVTNSYGHSIVGGPVRDNVFLGAPVDATRAGVEDGQVIVFSGGNGLFNAFVVPMVTYWSSQKGPDWMVTVGAVSPSSKQSYSGHGKPVDISSIGSGYPSSGGDTMLGEGRHSGTSNAAPVTAGTFAKALYEARRVLEVEAVGHAAGVVAQGSAVACGAAVPTCALGDGVLTRAELQDLVFHNVLPSEPATALSTWPTTPAAYAYQGHGVIEGRVSGDAAHEALIARILDVAVGEVAPLDRPAGESNWFVVDSKCRQRLWGEWNGGYYDGTEAALDPVADPIATAFDTWCSAVPQDALR